MGLFSNNKKLCPICGNPTPRLLPTKVEDMPICKECDGKVDLPNGVINQMSLDGLQEYMAFYEENQRLRDIFTETYRYHVGFLSGSFLVDATNGLFRLKDNVNSLVMEATHLKSFRILEDSKPLYTSAGNVLKCFQSDVPDRIHALAPVFSQYIMEKEMVERMERMERARNRDDDNQPSPHRPHPVLNAPLPFNNFHIELILEHPYWSEMRWEISAPTISQTLPSVDNYLREYDDKVQELHTLARSLMELICPGAQEVYDGEEIPSVCGTAQVTDPVTEIKRYKELLDSGIISEEEFAVKKRQLLGL